MGKTKVENMEDILEALDSEQERSVEETFLDLHEPSLMDERIFQENQKVCKKYAYAVRNIDDSFL